jgi:hypothetical protein
MTVEGAAEMTVTTACMCDAATRLAELQEKLAWENGTER